LINRFKFKKMIEARTNGENQTPKATTPETITTSMIINDLENGIDRPGIKEKYGLETWEIAQMFKHPALKGKKARKVKRMSFNFVDDTIDETQMTVNQQIAEMRNESEVVDNYYQTQDDIKEATRELTGDDLTDSTAEFTEDFHNRADLRSQDAIDTSASAESEFTDEQMDQMEGEAWESLQDRSETTTHNQFNV
jgi:hypothetical protein